MIDYNKHLINSTYNQLISNLVVWQYLTNKVKADTEQGYKVVENTEIRKEKKRIQVTSFVFKSIQAIEN